MPKNIFCYCRVLDLSNNEIDDAGIVVFSRLRCLEVLNLSNNQLKCFKRLNLNKLLDLDLSKNQLERVDDDAFVDLKKLKSYL